MGFLDFLLTTNQKKENAAIEIGLESGLFVRCPVCRDVTEAGGKAAHMADTRSLIQQLLSENNPKVAIFKGNESELLETLTKVAEKLPYHCTCETI